MTEVSLREQNLKIVDTMLEKGLAGDFEALKQFVDPDFLCVEPDGLPYRGSYRGFDGYLGLFKALLATFDDLGFDRLGIVADDKSVWTRVELHGRAKNGESFSMQVAEIWEIRNGRVFKITPYYFDTKTLAEICERPRKTKAAS
jgi:ketosteroid isomerase-like protein